MNQQRSRRFRTAQEREEREAAKQALRAEFEAQGMTVPEEEYVGDRRARAKPRTRQATRAQDTRRRRTSTPRLSVTHARDQATRRSLTPHPRLRLGPSLTATSSRPARPLWTVWQSTCAPLFT